MPALLMRSIAITLTVLGATAAAQAASFPALTLPESGASGQRAIDLLGDRLPGIAAAYRRSPESLRRLLLEDRHFKLDASARLYVEDSFDAPRRTAAPHSAAPATVTGEAPMPLADTFRLHTRPGATRTIYLDFDGAVLQHTAWNNFRPKINAKPFDLDGDLGTFSPAELERIQFIWQRVAEDYAPFDVDVTTEAPPEGALSRTDETDPTYGVTALITNHNGVYFCSCGGVAYVGVFDAFSDFYKPALIFWDQLDGEEKRIAEAVSHEVGHTLGLIHDGDASSAYFRGHGSGATGWAPIMGVGYDEPVVQWSQGEYANANNTEDDIAVIQSHGALVRADDHGNQPASATALAETPSGAALLLAGAGVVETRQDRDVFSFQAGAGAATIGVRTDARSPNLDVRLRILDAGGTPLKTASPPGALGARASLTLPAAGTYYVVVEGVGFGDPVTNGYSDYGSLGQYTIAGKVPAP